MRSFRSNSAPLGPRCGSPPGSYGMLPRAVKPVARRGTVAVVCAVLIGAMAPASCFAATERPLKIVALGDSLTAGYGLPAEAAFPVKLERALTAKKFAVEITN